MIERKYHDELFEEAIYGIESIGFGQHLLNKFPLRMAEANLNTEQYELLKQSGSPACTDGKNVFYCAETMMDLLNETFYKYESSLNTYDSEQWWRDKVTDKQIELGERSIINSIRTVILHELTHAFNEHSKIRMAARKKSNSYRRRLQIACEIQANDGILGISFAREYIQQPEGVINKRLFPETIGYHTLQSIMAHLPNDNDSRMKQASKACEQDGKLSEQMMKTTGQYDKIEQELEGGGKGDPKLEKETADQNEHMEKSTDDAITDSLIELGEREVKNLILASISPDLKYDATSKSVIYDQVKKRVSSKTYSRPSKRIGMYGKQQYSIISKGKKYERVVEPNTAKHLTVLAVDASGSMSNMQEHVADITNDLLKQVKKIAEENKLTVDYSNLLATIHTENASELQQVESQSWKDTMRRYYADGGNDFSEVLTRIGRDVNVQDYDAITIINVSDGLDTLRPISITNPMSNAIFQGKVQWVDAIIDADAYNEAGRYKHNDTYKIREQVLVAK